VVAAPAVVAGGLQEPHAGARGEHPVGSVVGFAGGEQDALGQPPCLVEAGEFLGGAVGVDNERAEVVTADQSEAVGRS